MKKQLISLLVISGFVPSCLMAKVPEIPRDTSFTAYSTNIKVRKKHPEVQLALPELPAGVKEYRDVVYTTIKGTPYGNRKLHVDIFRPDDDKTYPALLMVHGGGWNSGNKSLQVPMAQQIAAQGYVTIPVEYRLTPEATYPAGLHDLKTAIRWARANAAKYGIDPDKIAVSGCSAGAQLATLAGVTNGSKRHEGSGQWSGVSSDVQAVINMDGIATFVSESNIADANERLAKKGVKPVNALWLGGMYDEAKDNWEEASALLWITDKSAPVCFISSGLPRYSDGRDSLVQIYDTKGIYTERNQIPVDVHPFWFFHPWVDTTVDHAVRFLDRMFKPETINSKRSDVLAALRKANDYFLVTYPDPHAPIKLEAKNTEYPSNIWTRAVYYEGLMDLYKIDPQIRYLDYLKAWGDSHEWKMGGRAQDAYTRNADNQSCGQAYMQLYQLDSAGYAHAIVNIKESLDSMMRTDKVDDWWWIDALQMGMPNFALMGRITGDTTYYQRAYDMYRFTRDNHGVNGLYNPEDKLWWRDKDFVPPYTTPNGEDCYWSRGNGWVIMAMCRMLDILPEDESHRAEYARMLVDMCEALVPLQRGDGFWNVSLHDEADFGGKESTGTSMFVYGMAYGINHGLLDAAIYRPVVEKAWSALVRDALHDDGFIGYTQGTGKQPSDGQPVTYDSQPDIYDYGLGAFLCAGVEVYKMLTADLQALAK